MDIFKRAIVRLMRVAVSGVLATLIKWLIEYISGLPLPDGIIVALTALISAIGKWLRDNLKLEVLI